MMRRLTLMICGIGLLAGCTKEQPPRSVTDFLESPILLEAAMVRCAKNRSATRYEAECVNAREAVRSIQAKEEASDEAEMDASFERKRKALRRTQRAVAEARRRAAESERLRLEAEYLAQFGEVPPVDDESAASGTVGSIPDIADSGDSTDTEVFTNFGQTIPASDGGNAPVAAVAPAANSDLESVRDELRRRDDEADN